LVLLTPPGLFLSSEDHYQCPSISVDGNFCLFYCNYLNICFLHDIVLTFRISVNWCFGFKFYEVFSIGLYMVYTFWDIN
jgi:hypothetical protein